MVHMHRAWRLLILMVILIPTRPQAQQAPPGCREPVYELLNFWLGHWNVHLSGGDESQIVGTNLIEKSAGGCAVFEHWRDAGGGTGESIFYYHPTDRVWKQVWVQADGLVKEKRAVSAPAPGSVRFQGEVQMRNGTRVFDRTTLTPLPGDRVRQHIEISDDGGETWKSTFDAIYIRRR